MKTLVHCIRLASYAICLAVFVTIRPTLHVIPVRLEDTSARQEEIKRQNAIREAILHDQQAAAKFAAAVVTSKDFRNARMSGQRVVTTALAAATRDGRDSMEGLGEPRISLKDINDRLVWHVGFYGNSPSKIPGGFFVIEIDDETEKTVFHPGM